MDFSLNDEQRLLRDTVRDFALREIAPHAAAIDESSTFPAESVRQMAALGLMGMMVPTELSGGGMDTLSYLIVLEELAAACAATAVTMSVNNSLYLGCLMKFANDAQQRRFVPDWAQGKKLGAYALSEPGSGSDAAALCTTAVRQGAHYLLTGTKNFITNGPQAHALIIFARTSPDKHHGISAFIVENCYAGFSVGKIEKKLGIRASSTSEIILKECAVPVENRLGAEGDGFKIALTTLDAGRLGIGVQALGIARAAFEAATKYAAERQAFGQAIAKFQAIQWKLADMAVGIDAARLLLWRAAWLKDQGKPFTKEAAMAKLAASEMAMQTTNDAIQIHGGYGYIKDYPVERYFRDAKITEIYEGTSEIQRLVIARQVLKEIVGE